MSRIAPIDPGTAREAADELRAIGHLEQAARGTLAGCRYRRRKLALRLHERGLSWGQVGVLLGKSRQAAYQLAHVENT